ncbi:hypothetical protein [Nocardiopsis sp. LOL_012]|uniref:hypothetical protein n=1 Tax=Nocardiopsis sp. LOL_012 TaxID=3345409 RepID=UPI003A8A3E47
MNILLSPSEWTPEWVAAIAGVVASLGAVGAFTVAVFLFCDQRRSLKATTRTLTEELRSLREERTRHRRAQASLVHIRHPQEEPDPRDVEALRKTFAADGINDTWTLPHVEVVNHSPEPVQDVNVTVEDAGPAARYVADFDRWPRVGAVSVLSPKQSVRVYWKAGFLRPEMTRVEFTDESGVRWCRPFQGKLVEVPEEQ